MLISESQTSPIWLLWRYLAAPLLYPVLSLPIMLVGTIARPVQTILILVTTGLLYLHWIAASGFVVVAALYYGYLVFVPPRDPRGYVQWARAYPGAPGGGVASVVFTVGLLTAFLLSMIMLPSFQPILRWLGAVGISYYAATVAMAYVVAFTTPVIVVPSKQS